MKLFLGILVVVASLAAAAWIFMPKPTVEKRVELGKKPPPLVNLDMITEADKALSYKKRSVNINGQVVGDPEYDDQGTHFQLFVRHGQEATDVIVDYPGNLELTDGDFISVQGRVSGAFTGKSEDGDEFSTFRVKSKTVNKVSPETVVAPPKVRWRPRAAKTEHDVETVVDRVEFADSETRFYLTVRNKGPKGIVVHVFDSSVVQAGKALRLQPNQLAKYPELPVDLSAGSGGAGVLVFPAMDARKPLTLIVGISAADWEKDIKFNLAAK